MARKPMTKARAKRLIGIGTTVAPLLAPYALAAASAVRGGWDSYRAGRLGVSTDRLAEFTGPGGGLHARVSHLADALNDIGSRTTAAKEFADQARPRLAELATAVRAAEQMPASRRRTAFKAISAELDGIEQGVLTHLGITT
jgi:outer membrane murein-binding lipoprotein Lpp